MSIVKRSTGAMTRRGFMRGLLGVGAMAAFVAAGVAGASARGMWMMTAGHSQKTLFVPDKTYQDLLKRGGKATLEYFNANAR